MQVRRSFTKKYKQILGNQLFWVTVKRGSSSKSCHSGGYIYLTCEIFGEQLLVFLLIPKPHKQRFLPRNVFLQLLFREISHELSIWTGGE